MRRGFTLVELLVVIAIIGFLSSIVLASLDTARTKANTSQVAEQMRELRTAILRYYAENGVYPTSTTPPSTSWIFSSSYPTSYVPQIVSAGMISSLPTPPSGCSYAYATINNGQGYKLKMNSCTNVIVTSLPQLIDPGQSAGSANAGCSAGTAPASPSGLAFYSDNARCLY